MKPIIHLKSGKLVLVKFNSDGTLTPNASTMYTALGTPESIATSVTINTTDMPDGNSQFPMGVYDTSRDGQLQVTMSSFQPKLYAALMGSEQVDEVDSGMWAAEEEHTVPSSGTAYEVTLEHPYNSTGTIVIVDEAGSPFSKIESAPAAGEFSVSADTVTFSSVDAGKGVLVTYEWDAAKTSKIHLPSSGSRPVLHAIISTLVSDEDELNEYPANIIADKCKLTGDAAQPSMQSTPQNWSFNLRILKPRGGYNPVYWKYATEL